MYSLNKYLFFWTEISVLLNLYEASEARPVWNQVFWQSNLIRARLKAAPGTPSHHSSPQRQRGPHPQPGATSCFLENGHPFYLLGVNNRNSYATESYPDMLVLSTACPDSDVFPSSSLSSSLNLPECLLKPHLWRTLDPWPLLWPQPDPLYQVDASEAYKSYKAYK